MHFFALFFWNKLYLSIDSSQLLGHTIVIFGQLSWWFAMSITFILASQWAHVVLLWGHFNWCAAISYWYTMAAQSLLLQFTISIGHSPLCLWRCSRGPVQVQPLLFGHLVSNLWITACNAKLRAGLVMPRKLLSTGQVLRPPDTAVSRHLPHIECPSRQMTGSRNTAKLLTERIMIMK